MDNKVLHHIFNTDFLDAHSDEWGIVIHCPEPDVIGFATTLTPALIKQAAGQNINLLVTHHDTWDFLLEERSISLALLDRYKISHIWCHAPLDSADFGTAASLLATLDCKIIGTIAEGDGRVGQLPKQLHLPDVIKLLQKKLSEDPCRMNDANRPISRVGCVTGAGTKISYLTEAIESGIDLFITGETNLYLLEYASFRNINVLVYSHNYTEIFGTKNLADRIASQLGIRKIIRLDEPHF